MQGGCACGAVRFRLASAPHDAGYCHCRTCQLNSGSPAMMFAAVPVADWVVEVGADRLKSFASSSFGRRIFCGDCGTPLYMRVDDEPVTLDFSVATLDEPDLVAPGFHIFWASRIVWFDPGDALPRYERART